MKKGLYFLFLLFFLVNLGNFAQVLADDGDDTEYSLGDVPDDVPENDDDIEGENKHLIYLTLSPKSEQININVITDKATTGQYKVSVEEGKSKTSQKTKFEYNLSNNKDDLAHDADDLGVYTVAVDAPGDEPSLEYKVNGLESSNVQVKQLDTNKDDTNLNVCVFGDYRADLYTQIDMSLSKVIEDNKCNLNLFTGKVTWEQRPNGFSFNPYIMLHDDQKERHIAFSKVPSIFGEVGHDLKETTFFQSVEVNNVAFIQTTVTLVTVANISYGTEQFDKVEEYFRETMLNELECKLQELHRRTRKPWIIVYLTHPSLFKDRQVNWLMLNSVDRFFEILKRYKIDLLTSCGIEGMSQILKDRAVSHPEEQLPAYVQTTLAECGGYQAFAPGLQNECSYAVLNIRKDKLNYVKKNPLPNEGESVDLDKGSIDKNQQEPDKCVEIDL